MKIFSKLEKFIVFAIRDILYRFNMDACSRFMVKFYRRKGMKINGQPNYLSSKIQFDGRDYSQIELNDGCSISSHVRVLTHDMSLYTIGRGIGLKFDKPIGIFLPIKVGKFSLVGTCSVLLPGANIGEGAVVGAGSVVRGYVPPWTIVVGSPAQPVGDSREFLLKQLKRQGLTKILNEAVCLLKEKGYKIPEGIEND